MTKQSESGERTKKLKGLTTIAVVPVILSIVDSSFTDTFMAVFAPGARDGNPVMDMLPLLMGGRWLAMGLMAFMMYMWVRPAILYPRDPRPEYLVKMKGRFLNVYRDLAIMFVAAFAARLITLFSAGHVPPGLLLDTLLALLVSFLAQASVLLVYVDFTFSMNQDFMTLLFTKEELYSPRQGLYVPLYIKVGGLITTCAIIPFLMLHYAFKERIPVSVFGNDAATMLFISGIMLVIGMRFIFHGIQKPLDGLIAKMRRVSDGDYDVKTRVYFSDEVARLKAGFNEMLDGLKERAELQDTFGKYLSIEIARELIHNKKVNLGGEDIEAAVMFCDIRNFTPLSESMSAAEVVAFLNEYFRYVTVPITSHHGVINKFIGDAVMAVFTPQLGSADYAADAVRAAVDMRRALAEFNAARGGEPVAFGVGVHCGRLVAGNVGTFSRLEYTFIGDTVNAASRLQGKTKDYGVDLLVSGEVTAKARGSLDGAVSFEPLGKAALKGRVGQLEVYKVV